jgi:putative ABC transport system substrate-binding protein
MQLLFVLSLAAASYSLAQQSHGLPVVAVPMITAGADDPMMEALRRGLRERGYVEGQNIRIEHRSAHGNMARLPEVVQELVRLKPVAVVAAIGAIVVRLNGRRIQSRLSWSDGTMIRWRLDSSAR